jgi:hypothetical protein
MFGGSLMLDTCEMGFFEERHDSPEMAVSIGLEKAEHRDLHP